MSSERNWPTRREAVVLAGGLAVMALIPENPVVGGTVLRRQAIQSPNFVAGSAGWTINQDGSAEFNNLVIRNGQIISGTALYYSGPPALGNLVASIAAAPGADTFGNAYLAGVTSYAATGQVSELLAGLLKLGNVSDSALAVINAQHGQNQITSGLLNAGDLPASLLLLSAHAAGGPGNPSMALNWSAGAGQMLTVTNLASAPSDAAVKLIANAAADRLLGLEVAGDAFLRFQVDSDGTVHWGTGGAAPDTTLSRTGGNQLTASGQLVATVLKAIAAVAGNQAVDVRVTGDTNPRFQVLGSGNLTWGPGNAANDITLSRLAANSLGVSTADLAVDTVGRGLQVKEGANAKQGTAVLSAGTVVVANTSVTANSRIMLTAQNLGTVTTPSALCVSARTAGTSFTIKASQATDTSTVAYEIFEPAP